MNKDNKSIKQINVANKLSNNVINQFPTAQRHIDDMSKLGFSSTHIAYMMII